MIQMSVATHCFFLGSTGVVVRVALGRAGETSPFACPVGWRGELVLEAGYPEGTADGTLGAEGELAVGCMEAAGWVPGIYPELEVVWLTAVGIDVVAVLAAFFASVCVVGRDIVCEEVVIFCDREAVAID